MREGSRQLLISDFCYRRLDKNGPADEKSLGDDDPRVLVTGMVDEANGVDGSTLIEEELPVEPLMVVHDPGKEGTVPEGGNLLG